MHGFIGLTHTRHGSDFFTARFLYKDRQDPRVKFEGAPPRTVTAIAITIGAIFVLLGILGYWYPKNRDPNNRI
jgi:hypothetical protein